MNFSKDKYILSSIILGGLIVRILVSPNYTHYSDMGLWRYWANAIEGLGFNNFFDKVSWTDYLPFYFYILFILEKISDAFGITSDLLFKMPSILADLITGTLIFLLTRRYQIKNSLLLTGLYIFNPAIFANSAMWGQVDGIGALLMVTSLYLFITRRVFLLGITLGIAILFKPIYLIALPVVAVAQLKADYTKLFYLAISLVLSVMVVIAPFVGNIFFIPQLIYQRYTASLTQYSFASVNAFNFWGALGKNWVSDNILYLNISYHLWGLIIFGLFFALLLLFLLNQAIKSNNHYLFTLSFVFCLVFLTAFTFATRAHERHLLTILPFLIISMNQSRLLMLSFFALSTIYVANLYFGIHYLYLNGGFIWNTQIVQLFSFGVVLIWILLVLKLFLGIFSLRKVKIKL